MMSLFKKNADGKFGTIKGVFIPNALQMLGVILFMRLSYVLGHVGIAEMGTIIIVSAILLLITGLSLASIVSNMRVRSGGAYYLISRSLGIEFGSSIGVLLCISQLCTAALCINGFTLSLYEFYSDIPLPVLNIATLSVLFLISYLSTDWALKFQVIIFSILLASIGAIFFGSGPVPENFVPSIPTETLSFWMAFAMFFPAMTGIESGISLSGDLRNPSRSIPIGTMAAIIIVSLIYFGIAVFLANNVSSELLTSSPLILYYISKVGFLIIAGIWAATLSSALGAILGGPRVMQAIAADGILPQALAKGHGPLNQPRAATLVVFVFCLILTVAINIDQIIPILTMSCLLSYGLLNFIAFFEAFMQNPSWRPAIKVPPLVSLAGGLGCFMAMFMINPGATFIVMALVFLLCLWTMSRNVKGNWGDLRYSIFSFFIHKAAVKLSNLEKNEKSWRPHILTFFETPSVNKNLAFFSHALNQEKGFLTFATTITSSENSDDIYQKLKNDLRSFNIPSHIHVNHCAHTVMGADQIIRNYGFGFLKPNTIVLPISAHYDTDAFVKLLLDTHRMEKNIILMKDYLFTHQAKNENKQVNLWWRGKHPGNFELSLALAYLLQQGKFWPNCKISIKMIAKNEKHKERLTKYFTRLQSKLRIKNLEFAPIVDKEDQFFQSLHQNTPAANLTFLGLKKPDATTSVEDYKEYYLRLLNKTESLDNVTYVLCGEKIKFRKIFV